MTQAFDRICIDSRHIQPGEVFWALRGKQHNGHNFLKESIQGGAIVGIVDSRKLSENFLPTIRVKNTQAALEDFAGWHRSRQSADVIAVTGSVGKTTTRRMIFDVLRQQFSGVQSPRNFNNHIGVPLSVFEMSSHHDFAVFELGASGAGEIRDLGRLVAPDLGVITAIAPAHLDGFGDIETIVREKSSLLDCLPSDGLAVLNGDDERLRNVADQAHCCVVFVGETEHNHIQATNVTTDLNQLRFEIDERTFTVPVTGRHHLTSALAAVAVGRELGLDERVIAHGLACFQPESGRCHVEQFGTWTVIDDTYNSSPRSMQAACEVLGSFRSQRRVLIAADMLELGDEAARLHRACGTVISNNNIDLLVAVGEFAEEFAHGVRAAGGESTQVIVCGSREDVPAVLESHLRDNDVILVKGSRSTRMETIVVWLREQAPPRMAAA